MDKYFDLNVFKDFKLSHIFRFGMYDKEQYNTYLADAKIRFATIQNNFKINVFETKEDLIIYGEKRELYFITVKIESNSVVHIRNHIAKIQIYFELLENGLKSGKEFMITESGMNIIYGNNEVKNFRQIVSATN